MTGLRPRAGIGHKTTGGKGQWRSSRSSPCQPLAAMRPVASRESPPPWCHDSISLRSSLPGIRAQKMRAGCAGGPGLVPCTTSASAIRELLQDIFRQCGAIFRGSCRGIPGPAPRNRRWWPHGRDLPAKAYQGDQRRRAADGAEIESTTDTAGFAGIRCEELPLTPVSAVCVLGSQATQ
jgi:hypothetical protein